MRERLRSRFFKLPGVIKKTLEELNRKPAGFWDREGEKMALRLFRFVCQSVPAYRSLLGSKGINDKSIKIIEDFKKLPLIDKGSYLRKYNYRDLLPKNILQEVTTISATSGSTGEPFYFPRGEEQDWQYEYLADIYLRKQFGLDRKKTTLGIIGFGMGIWIGGVFTYKVFNELAKKSYNLSLAPIGPNVDLYLRTVKAVGPLYDRIILMGYPPFIKDVIDRGEEYGVNWKDYKIKILTSAEGHTEGFRDYICEKTHVKNLFTDTINMYGTVELGTMGHETPLSILIRRKTVEDKRVFAKIFPRANRLPTLVQYHPNLIYFEEIGDEAVATGFGSSIPLLRYRFPDVGGVIPFESMISRLKDLGIDVLNELKKMKLEKTLLKLPFVYVYERSDFAVKLHLRDIYPETIKDALISKPLNKILTGKFAMATEYNKKHNQYLELNMELRKGKKIDAGLKKVLYRKILEAFYSKTSGPGSPTEFVKRPNLVKMIFWPAEHPLYFKSGNKQRWVKNK